MRLFEFSYMSRFTVRRVSSYMFCLMIALFFSLSQAAITYTFDYKSGGVRYDESALIKMVGTGINIQNPQIPYGAARVNVYSKNNGTENYLNVFLTYEKFYGLEAYRIDIKDGKVVNVIKDYYEESGNDERVCTACPDPEVQVVLSNLQDSNFPLADSKPKEVADSCAKYNIKVVRLRGSAEKKATVLSYLNCPKLVLWGRIGHGDQSGNADLASGEFLGSSDISKNAAIFKDKYFPLNSCYIAGNTFGTAMIAAKAKFIAAGDNQSLGAGTSEPTWAKFCIDVLIKNKEVIKAYTDNMKSASGMKDPWGYKTSGTGPYYLFNTSIVNGSLLSNQLSQILNVTSNKIFLSLSGLNNASRFMVYNLNGRLLYQENVTTSDYVWNMNTASGEKINIGKYIAVVQNNSNQKTSKTFTVAK